MSEAARHRADLTSRPGAPGSGARRYAAAMYFFNRGEMTAEMLEIYRCCSKFDHEDPIKVAKYEAVPVPPLPPEMENAE